MANVTGQENRALCLLHRIVIMLSEKYSKLKTLQEAKKIFLSKLDFSLLSKEEKISVDECAYRVTSRPVFSEISSPNFAASAMDGFAVDSHILSLLGNGNRKKLKINLDAFPVNTGDALPENTNTILPIEKVKQICEKSITVDEAQGPWKHVRMIGEDVSRGELIIPLNHLVSPFDVGLLLSSGVKELWVRKRPRVLIVPTGSELFSLCEKDLRQLEKGEIIEFNSHIVYQLLKDAGALPERHSIIPDKGTLAKILLERIRDVAIIIIIAGASVGSKDHTAEVIRNVGELVIHGIKMRPGKPTVLGIVEGKPVIGLPGYAVSAIISLREFVVPIVERILSITPTRSLKVKATQAIKFNTGFDEFIRVKIVENGNAFLSFPLRMGISIISPLSKADGIIRLPFNSQSVDEGELVDCELLKSVDTIKKNIVVVGEEDPIFGVLDEMLRETNCAGEFGNLFFLNHGSLGGVKALKKAFLKLAVVSFSDDTEEKFQVMSLLKMNKQSCFRLIRIAQRDLGLMLDKRNTNNIGSLADIARFDVNFVNRQCGSSPRNYLDKEIKRRGITKEQISGYDVELYSNLSVGLQIKEGFANVGLGIYPVAKAYDLAFIGLVKESYDLLTTEGFMKERMFSLLMDILCSRKFTKRLESMGYYVEETGKIIF